MKAIETVYKKCRFRSRLEARWAVFFDTLGIEWEYEPEGFDLEGAGYYLPDFRLHNVRGNRQPYTLYVEVKALYQDTEGDKAQILVFAYDLWEEDAGKAILVAGCPSDKLHIYNPAVTDGGCSPSLEYNTTSRDIFGNYSNFDLAMEAARQARFDHGQVGAPANWRGYYGRV